jgi:hypothetical protein
MLDVRFVLFVLFVRFVFFVVNQSSNPVTVGNRPVTGLYLIFVRSADVFLQCDHFVIDFQTQVKHLVFAWL